MSAAFEAAWASATTNPLSFDLWEAVLRVAVNEPIETTRKGFNGFLEKFPLCYGYWNQFALAESKQTEDPAIAHAFAKAVFERAAAAVPHSVDNWVNYAKYLTDKGSDPVPSVVAVYERGLALTMHNKQAVALWTGYLGLLKAKGTPKEVSALYKRVLGTPLTYLEEIWTAFQGFAAPLSFADLAVDDDVVSAAEQSLTALMAAREAEYKASKDAAESREPFEAAIVQHFYLARPVAETSLTAWRMYLDFEEGAKDTKRVESLYGRCLIVCAHYAEFWLRYADWKLATAGHAAAATALVPAVMTFLPNRPDVALRRARELELAGDTTAAREAFQSYTSTAGKGLVQAAVKFANFERRAGNAPAGAAVLEAAYSEASGQSKCYLALQWAHYLEYTLGDVDAARAALAAITAADTCGSSPLVWQALASFSRRHPGGDATAAVTAALKAGLACSTLGNDSKEELWLRLLDHLEASAETASDIAAAESEHKAWAAAAAVELESKKRTATEAAQSAAKVARTDGNPTAGAAAAAAAAPAGNYDFASYVQQQYAMGAYGGY